MLLRPAIALMMGIGSAFGPRMPLRELFGNGEQGLWYDLNDDSTIYQDSAGTTLATWGDPVGRVNDKSGNGNDAVQSTSGARPIRGRMPKRGRVNELVSTATMATQNVTVTAAQRTLSFTGTGTVTLSGASTAGPLVGTGVSDRVSLTFTPSAGTLTLTVSGSVTLAQLQLGAAFDNYQAVNDSLGYNITESGQPSCGYLSFNGSNQWMQTASAVDLSGTSQVSVFAGARKIVDTPSGAVLAAVTSITNGRITVFIPTAVNANSITNSVRSSTGNDVSVGVAGTMPVLTNKVVTLNADLSAPLVSQRVNGAEVSTSTSALGGTFANITLYFGATGGTTNYFNGLMFSIIIRGALTSGTLLTRTEQYVARQTPTVNL